MIIIFRITMLLNLVVGVFVVQALELPKPVPSVHKDLKVEFLYYAARNLPFHPPLLDGVQVAGSVLDCKVNLVQTRYDEASLLYNFKSAVSRAPDVICVPGMRDAPSLNTFIREAVDQGITVTTYDEQSGELPPATKWKGTGFIGERPRESGRAVANELLRRHPIPEDKFVLIISDTYPTGSARTAGCIDVFTERGVAHQMFRVTPYASFHVNKSLKTDLRDYGEQVGAVVCLTANTDMAAALVYRYDPNIPTVGYGYSRAIEEFLLEGKIEFVYEPNWFAQGALSVIQTCLARNGNLTGLECELPMDFLDRESLASKLSGKPKERE